MNQSSTYWKSCRKVWQVCSAYIIHHAIGILYIEINPLESKVCSKLIYSYSRVIHLAGENGNLTKENFTKFLRSSDLFLKAFDKNKDRIVTKVEFYILESRTAPNLVMIYDCFLATKAGPWSLRPAILYIWFIFADRDDDKGSAGF